MRTVCFRRCIFQPSHASGKRMQCGVVTSRFASGGMKQKSALGRSTDMPSATTRAHGVFPKIHFSTLKTAANKMQCDVVASRWNSREFVINSCWVGANRHFDNIPGIYKPLGKRVGACKQESRVFSRFSRVPGTHYWYYWWYLSTSRGS